jgi:hypothetical protein
MNDIDNFERELARLLNRSVDERLGTRRPAPPFLPASGRPASIQRAKRWLLPLAAAACVIAVVGGTMSATQLLTAHRHGPTPGNSVPDVSTPPASDSGAPSSTPPTVAPAPAISTGPGPSATPSSQTVQLGGATLHLPAGWVARDYQQYLRPGLTLPTPAWCLTPADQPASTAQFSCPVEFDTFADKAAGNRIDVDTEGGYASDPHYCPPAGATRSYSVRSADVPFGGRVADFRRFDIGCPDGKQWRIEQYVVASGPGYILWSEIVDDRISAVMAQLVAGATLPAQTSAVRYYDHGYVRSITPAAGGAQIAIDRVVPGPAGPVNNNPKTYDYFVPQSAKPDGLHVGELITLFTDGSQVLERYGLQVGQ